MLFRKSHTITFKGVNSFISKPYTSTSPHPYTSHPFQIRFINTNDSNDVSKLPSLNQFKSETGIPQINNKINIDSNSTSEPAPPVFFQSEIPPKPFNNNNNGNTHSIPIVENVKQSNFLKFLYIPITILTALMITMDLYSSLSPANTEFVSEETLKFIESAINAENNNNLFDAIQFYLKALDQLDSEGEEHISPCYTSCSIRIAELFEHNKQFDKALLIYKELSNTYLNAFTHIDDFKTLINDESYDFAILRSLTIAIRYAYLLPENDVNKAREILMFNIIEAQKRIIELYPPFLSILNDINNRNILDILTSDLEKKISHLNNFEQEKIINEQSKNPIELPLFTTEQSPENKILGLHIKAWPVFTRVLINAKDLYSNLSIEANDLSSTISNLTNNSIIIQRCFDHPSRLTLTLTKLGIALQMTYQTINKDFPKGKEIEIIKDNKPVKVNLSSPELKDFVLNTTNSESKRIFLKVLSLCDTMKRQEKLIKSNHLNSQNDIGQWESMFKPALEKSEMVSSASLGMISFQSNDYSEALKYFKRAKILAFKLNDQDYINDINSWIELLTK
ncbi:hypothetical protein C6P40_004545 [Pichia californica]|uniref:Uncharacterized protein n=1 Tax=Pichia californica TaxID=460514 RepID=A0A9P6WPE9_9ASCO|nr:hypothetical protein C6P42_005002 [[Candida] californica]KAG0689743.1 hypothetical protein C6P40_004545 [[Candida] californica]